MVERWIDYFTAKELLKKVCTFLKPDGSGIADFVLSSKEAVILSLYSSAFFLLNEDYGMKFKLATNALSSSESVTVFPL